MLLTLHYHNFFFLLTRVECILHSNFISNFVVFFNDIDLQLNKNSKVCILHANNKVNE